MKIAKVESFFDIEEYIEDTFYKENSVAFISDIDTMLDVAVDLYGDFVESTFDFIDVDRLEYDKEYVLSIGEVDGKVIMHIERAYSYEREKYIGIDGTVYIDKNVDPKFVKDCMENQLISGFTPIMLVYNDDDVPDCADCEYGVAVRDDDGTSVKYTVPKCMSHVVSVFDEILADMFDLIMD